jgi:hypothetical protein
MLINTKFYVTSKSSTFQIIPHVINIGKFMQQNMKFGTNKGWTKHHGCRGASAVGFVARERLQE